MQINLEQIFEVRALSELLKVLHVRMYKRGVEETMITGKEGGRRDKRKTEFGIDVARPRQRVELLSRRISSTSSGLQ
jgi:hypothetical protein